MPLAELTASMACSARNPELISTPAAIKPDRPMPRRQCTATLCPELSSVAIRPITSIAAAVDAGTPRSGIAKEMKLTA